ncbi:MAG: HIT family protein [Candidatus Woesearchaeota archaeon]
MLKYNFIDKIPNDFNIGINDGSFAGRTIDHFHIQIIPRFEGDIENPVGGIRNVIPGFGDYKSFNLK